MKNQARKRPFPDGDSALSYQVMEVGYGRASSQSGSLLLEYQEVVYG